MAVASLTKVGGVDERTRWEFVSAGALLNALRVRSYPTIICEIFEKHRINNVPNECKCHSCCPVLYLHVHEYMLLRKLVRIWWVSKPCLAHAATDDTNEHGFQKMRHNFHPII